MQSEPKEDESITSEEAQAIVAQAQADVAKSLTKAETEISAWVKEGQEAGAKRGFEQAEQLRAKLAKLQELMLGEVEGEVVRAAFDVAENILQAEIKASPQAIVQVVQTALKGVPEVSQVWLRVNPADAPAVRSGKQQIIDVMERAKDIDIREDRQVEKGGVLIQTESGVIDAQLKTQLEEIARVLGV